MLVPRLGIQTLDPTVTARIRYHEAPVPPDFCEVSLFGMTDELDSCEPAKFRNDSMRYNNHNGISLPVPCSAKIDTVMCLGIL